MEPADEWITRLDLQRHPEGGWYKEWYRSGLELPVTALGGQGPARRNLCTSIWYLLRPGEFSAFHRIRSDELWHHLEGDSMEVVMIDPKGKQRLLTVGPAHDEEAAPAGVVPAGTWFAARPKGPGASLVGCTVSPGFDFGDFQLADRATLIGEYPPHEALITALTRED